MFFSLGPLQPLTQNQIPKNLNNPEPETPTLGRFKSKAGTTFGSSPKKKKESRNQNKYKYKSNQKQKSKNQNIIDNFSFDQIEREEVKRKRGNSLSFMTTSFDD